MKVAVIQHDITWGDRDANFTKLTPLVAQASSQGARLVILPEMFSTGFIVDSTDIAEPTNGPSWAFLSQMSKTHAIWIAGSCPERDDDDPRPYNSLVITSPTGDTFRYRKIHPFSYGGEDLTYRSGNSFTTVEIDDIRVSFFICYDLRFADEFWQLARTTDVFVVPANWPSSRREHWNTLLRARAIENQAYVIGCNRIGDGGGLDYSGESCIIDPFGRYLQQAGSDEEILIADITAQSVADIRARFPFLDDRR